MLIRPATDGDADAIWAVMEPIIRAGETYTLPRDMDRDSALAYWLSPEREVFVAEDHAEIVGTYCLQANQKGGGAKFSSQKTTPKSSAPTACKQIKKAAEPTSPIAAT